MKKKKLLIVVLVLLMLIISFFVLTKKPKIKYKKLKELNYNLTYKQAFPDENLRRSVVLCIMRDRCKYTFENYFYENFYQDNSNYLTDTRLGLVITEEQLKAKEEEQISKQDLDKLEVLVPNNMKKEISTLQGIEYLSKLISIELTNVQQEHLDFSYNKKLKSLGLYAKKANSINLDQNLELKEVVLYLSENEKNLDLSHLTKLEKIISIGSGLKVVRLPNGVTSVHLKQNKITDINIPSSVKYLDLQKNNLTHIDLPEGIKDVLLQNNKINNIDIPSTVKMLYLNYNNLTSITLPSDIENAVLGYNKIKNVTLKGPVKNLELQNNNISNIDLQEGITHVNLENNNISHINLPNSIMNANLSSNKISTIDLTNNANLTVLDLSNNLLEDIDLRNNLELINVKFSLNNSKDTIDFSNNSQLREVEIYGENKAKIKSLDFSNNPDLYSLKLSALGLTNLNIDNNINFEDINLTANNLESIDLSKNTKLRYITLWNNRTQNFKIPNLTYYGFTIKENRKLKVKKNSLVTIPNMFHNDKEYFLDENPNYEKLGDKYIFKNIGTYEINTSLYWTYEIEVENGEEDAFNPSIDQGNYTPLINEEIPVNKLKEMITNLPANIKNFEIISANTFADKGDKTVKVRITFSDDTFKEVDIPIKVYEKEYLMPEVEIINPNIEVVESKEIKEVKINVKEVNERVDNINFIKYVKDDLLSETITNLNGLTNTLNKKLTGKFTYNFIGNEEEKNIDIIYTRNYQNNGKDIKHINVKLLRDTDKDGIPDKDDDDKDGDGFSNAVEIVRGSDPYNKDSLPDMSKKDELDNLVKQLEKLIEDTKNNPFDTKNKIDVDNLKNNYLPLKETEKDNIKSSYDNTTGDTELIKLKEEVKEIIDDIKKEINKLRDKASFIELDKEIAKEIKDIYTKDSLNPLKEKLEEAKKLNRDTAKQEEVDKLTKTIKELRDKLIIDNNKKQEENKDINNPKTGIKTYSLVILFIIFISYLVFKKKKSYIR